MNQNITLPYMHIIWHYPEDQPHDQSKAWTRPKYGMEEGREPRKQEEEQGRDKLIAGVLFLFTLNV